MNIHAKRSLGQNFLVNEGIVKKIITAAELQHNDTVVEIGPGTGNLTRYIVDRVQRLILIEKDSRLIEQLKKEFGNSAEIIEADVLAFDPANLKLQALSFKLVANLPYYITSHFFKIVFEQWPRPERLVVMVQKEVAQRILAKPPQSNLLGLSVQLHAHATQIARVSAGSFHPIPEVDSVVIRLTPHSRPLLSESQEKILFTLTRAAFSGKRKKLANTLKLLIQRGAYSVEEFLVSAGIDPAARPQHLTLQDWIRLTVIFEEIS